MAKEIDWNPTGRKVHHKVAAKAGRAEKYDPELEDDDRVLEAELSAMSDPESSEDQPDQLRWLMEPVAPAVPIVRLSTELEASAKALSSLEGKIARITGRLNEKRLIATRHYYRTLLAFWRVEEARQKSVEKDDPLALPHDLMRRGPMHAAAALTSISEQTVYGHYLAALACEWMGLLDVKRFNEIVVGEEGESPPFPRASENGKVNDDGHLKSPVTIPRQAKFEGTQEEFDREFPLPGQSSAKAVGAGLLAIRKGPQEVNSRGLMQMARAARMKESLPSYNRATEIIRGKTATLRIDLNWIEDDLERILFMRGILKQLAGMNITQAKQLLEEDAATEGKDGAVRFSISGNTFFDWKAFKEETKRDHFIDAGIGSKGDTRPEDERVMRWAARYVMSHQRYDSKKKGCVMALGHWNRLVKGAMRKVSGKSGGYRKANVNKRFIREVKKFAANMLMPAEGVYGPWWELSLDELASLCGERLEW